VVVYTVQLNGLDNLAHTYLLKPKTRGKTEINDVFPIEALYMVNTESIDLSKVDITSLKTLEWVYLKFN